MNKSFNFFSSLTSFKTNFSGKKKLKARKKITACSGFNWTVKTTFRPRSKLLAERHLVRKKNFKNFFAVLENWVTASPWLHSAIKDHVA